MKKFLIFTTILIFSSFVETTFAQTLTLTVDNIKNIKGVMMIALYNSPATYKSDINVVQGKMVAVTDKILHVEFSDLAAGEYAIKLFQDENENKKMDTNLFGIPKEGYGFSNNGGAMSQPSFDDAKFSVDINTAITIHLR